MLRNYLVRGSSGQALHTAEVGIRTTDPVLIAHTEASIIGVFKSVNRTTAGATTIASVTENSSLILTDLLISTDRVAVTSVIVQFTDDTDTEIVFKLDTDNAPHAFGFGFLGRWQGWSGARLELVTTGSVDATVSLGYYKVDTSKPFAEWDALR